MKNKLVQKLKDIYYKLRVFLKLFLIILGFVFIGFCCCAILWITSIAIEAGAIFLGYTLMLLGISAELALIIIYFASVGAWSLE